MSGKTIPPLFLELLHLYQSEAREIVHNYWNNRFCFYLQGCVKALNEYMISANAPKDSHTFKSTTYGLGKAKHNFTFSRVFPESTSQKEFFSATMLKLVQDFIEGQNCLVFTYGITNAGKTYTIQGEFNTSSGSNFFLNILFC